jgi:hypothetical protein
MMRKKILFSSKNLLEFCCPICNPVFEIQNLENVKFKISKDAYYYVQPQYLWEECYLTICQCCGC